MTITNRDKRLLVFLPSLAVLVGYAVWFSTTGKHTALSGARTALERAEKAVPTDDRLLGQQMQLAMAEAEAGRALREAVEAKKRLMGHLACIDPDCRPERMHKLTSLLTRHGLTVIEHRDAEGGKDHIPPTSDALRKQLPLAATLQLHRIRFAARYRDVIRATTALAEEGAVAIPVSLTMKESPNQSEWHEWTMLVWV
jgi:hypothetical protein